jgi:trimeric autotransporter adhesin
MPSPGKISFWFVEPPVDDFPNSGFEDGLINWQILNTRVRLNGNSTILGWPTPTDPTPNPVNYQGDPSPGDARYVSSGDYNYSLVDDTPPGIGGTSALRLENFGQVNSGAILYGPAVISERRVTARVGDTVEFSWRALSGAEVNVGDAYNPFAYMIERSSGRIITILDVNANNLGFNTDWQTASRVIQAGEEGEYHFVFICGSFDATFGSIVGSAFIVDAIRLIKAV